MGNCCAAETEDKDYNFGRGSHVRGSMRRRPQKIDNKTKYLGLSFFSPGGKLFNSLPLEARGCKEFFRDNHQDEKQIILNDREAE